MLERERRRHERVPQDSPIDFTVLYVESVDLRKVTAAGRVVDSSPAGIGLVTEYPLEPGHVLQWNDEHRRGGLHIAMVKWSQRLDQKVRAGLIFI